MVTVFMTTLMMVGVVTLPLEIKYFGKKSVNFAKFIKFYYCNYYWYFNRNYFMTKRYFEKIKPYIWLTSFAIFFRWLILVWF